MFDFRSFIHTAWIHTFGRIWIEDLGPVVAFFFLLLPMQAVPHNYMTLVLDGRMNF